MASKKTFWDLALEITGNDKGAKAALKTVRDELEKVNQAGKQLGKDFKAFTGNASKLALGVVGGVTAITAATIGLANQFADTGSQIGKTASTIGMGVESYQKLQYAMDRSGVSAETFDTAMKKFSLTVKQGAAGNKVMAKQLADVGLSAEKLAGMKPEQAMERLSDYMNSLPDDAARTRAAVALFGKQAGPEMLVAMKQGSKGIAELMKKSEKYFTYTQEHIAQIKEYKNAQNDLKDSFSSLKNQFISASIGPLTEAFKILGDTLLDFGPDIESIGKKFGEFVKLAVSKLPEIIAKIKEFGTWVKDTLTKVVNFVGGWKNLGKIIAGIAIAPTLISGLKTVFSFGNLIHTAWKHLPKVLGDLGLKATGVFGSISGAILPIIGIIAGIALVIYTVIKNFDNLKAYAMECFERIKEAFGAGKDGAINFTEILGTVKKVLGVVLGILEGAMLFAIKTLMNAITSAIQIVVGAFKVLWNVAKLLFWPMATVIKVIVGLFTGGWSGAIDALKSQFGELGKIFSGIFDGIKGIFSGVTGFFKGQFQNAIEFVKKIFGSFGTSIGGVFDKIKSFFSGVGDFIKKNALNIINVIVGIIFFPAGVIMAVVRLIVKHWDAIKEAAGKAFDWICEKVSAAIDFIKNIFGSIGGFFTGIWDGAKNIAGKAWDGIKGAASNAWEGIKNAGAVASDFFKNRWNDIKEAGGMAFNFLDNISGGALTRMKDNFLNGINKIKEFFNSGKGSGSGSSIK